MKRWGSLLVVLLSAALLYANDSLDQQLWRDYLHRSETIVEDQGDDRLFNKSVNTRGEAGERVRRGWSDPGSTQGWIEDLARRRVCPREHPGEFFDTKYHSPGIWYCRGLQQNGQLCPYHIKVQFPNGIPKDRLI